MITVSRVSWPSWGRVGAVSKGRERLGEARPLQQPNALVHAPAPGLAWEPWAPACGWRISRV